MAKKITPPIAPTGYNISPTPVDNKSTFGHNIGMLGQPVSVYDQLKQNVPNYGALTQSATSNIGGELNGQLSPQTMDTIQNSAATKGVAGGYGGSQFQDNNELANLGLTSEALQHQGLTDYNQFATTTGQQQQAPELQYEVASQNALNAAAPNPAEAQNYAQSLFEKYLNFGKPKPSKLPKPESYVDLVARGASM